MNHRGQITSSNFAAGACQRSTCCATASLMERIAIIRASRMEGSGIFWKRGSLRNPWEAVKDRDRQKHLEAVNRPL